MDKRVRYGKGINDSDYQVTIRTEDKVTFCPYYSTWGNMLKRCYSEPYQKIQPTYKKCEVVGDWLLFSDFRKWMIAQDFKGKQLDKDILGDGTLYSEDTCIFIPQELNKLIADFSRKNRDLPCGVCWEEKRKKYVIQVGGGDKTKVIRGRYDTLEEAVLNYKTNKSIMFLPWLDYQDGRIRQQLLDHIKDKIWEGDVMSFAQWVKEYGQDN